MILSGNGSLFWQALLALLYHVDGKFENSLFSDMQQESVMDELF